MTQKVESNLRKKKTKSEYETNVKSYLSCFNAQLSTTHFEIPSDSFNALKIFSAKEKSF